MPMKPMEKPVCSICGGDIIELNASIEWNHSDQAFDICIIDNYGSCEICSEAVYWEWKECKPS